LNPLFASGRMGVYSTYRLDRTQQLSEWFKTRPPLLASKGGFR